MARIVVAASDGSAMGADYFCDGHEDNVEIQEAISRVSTPTTTLRTKFDGQHWFLQVKSYFLSRFPSVETRLAESFRYVELHRENRHCFSYELASILRDTGSIFGSVVDGLVRGSSPKPKSQYHFDDYRKFLQTEVPNLHRMTIEIRRLFPAGNVVPFEEMPPGSKGIPLWWDAQTRIKHLEYDEFRLGNLENCVTAVSALALLGHCMGIFTADSLFVNVGIVYPEGSIDMTDERLLFPKTRIHTLYENRLVTKGKVARS